MSSTNRYSLIISLPICIPFNSFSCLISQARNSRTVLNKSGERKLEIRAEQFLLGNEG
jgi:hypothetical protein